MSFCALGWVSGCAGALVEPGHRGLLFDPTAGGAKPDVLKPAYYPLASCVFRAKEKCARIDDFDVTFSTKHEEVSTTSKERLAIDLKLSITYRPVISELYELDTEIGTNYYDEIIGPEFKSAARGVFARHPYEDLEKMNESIENEVEEEVRRRTQNQHIEIRSVTIEAVHYADEIKEANRARIVGEQVALRQKAALENEALRKKLELEHHAEEERMKAESILREKDNEKKIAIQDAEIEKLKAQTESETRLVRAKAEAQELTLLAKAHAEEKRAENVGITPLTVMTHAYDALGSLGGTGTTIALGDWSKTPRFLFPQYGTFANPFGLGAPAGSGPSPAPSPSAAVSAPMASHDAASSTTARVLAATAPPDARP